ncbi:MAG: ABC transporter substrate-binding protein [Bacteroidales bacterium]
MKKRKGGIRMSKKLILGFILLPLISGCSVNPDGSEYEKVAITHHVMIDNEVRAITEEFRVNPEWVAFFNLGALDILDYVGFNETGIKGIGMPTASTVTPELEKYRSSATNVGTLHIPDPNALDLFMPDLIILDGRSRAYYSELKTAYPMTDILDITNSSYNLELQRESIATLAKLFPQLESKFDNALNEIETRLDAIKDVSQEYEAVFLMSNEKSLSIYGKNGRYGSLYKEFGFKEAVVIAEEPTHGQSIEVDYLVDVQPEVIFVMDRTIAAGGESGLDDLLSGPVFSALNAVKNNLVFELEAKAWYLVTGGISSTLQMIKDVEVFVNQVTT